MRTIEVPFTLAHVLGHAGACVCCGAEAVCDINEFVDGKTLYRPCGWRYRTWPVETSSSFLLCSVCSLEHYQHEQWISPPEEVFAAFDRDQAKVSSRPLLPSDVGWGVPVVYCASNGEDYHGTIKSFTSGRDDHLPVTVLFPSNVPSSPAGGAAPYWAREQSFASYVRLRKPLGPPPPLPQAAPQAAPQPVTPIEKVEEKKVEEKVMKHIWIQRSEDGEDRHLSWGHTKSAAKEQAAGGKVVGRPVRLEVPDDLDLELGDWPFAMDKLVLEQHPEIAAWYDGEEPAPARTGKLKNQGKRLGKAVALGAGLAVVDQGGDLLLRVAGRLGKNLPWLPQVLETPEGRELVKLVMAVGLDSLATHTSIVPMAEGVQKISEAQIALVFYKLIQPRLAEVNDLLLELAGLGSALSDDFELPRASLADGERVRANGAKRAVEVE